MNDLNDPGQMQEQIISRALVRIRNTHKINYTIINLDVGV